MRFAGDNVVQQVTLQQLKIGRTDIAVDWKRVPGGVELSLRGPSLELPRVRAMMKSRDELAAKEPAGAAATARSNTKMTLQIQQVLTERGTLGYVNGRLELGGRSHRLGRHDDRRRQGLDLPRHAGGIGPEPVPLRRRFRHAAEGRGLARRAGQRLPRISRATTTTAPSDSPLTGFLKMGPYRLQKVTPRADVGTLNSAIEGLGRAGNALQQFDGLEANVTKKGDRIQIKNGRTSGQSIGLTTQGFVDLGQDTARLGGVVVPAFALNNLLSNVPLLGPLLTGGKDGGLFAISYQLARPARRPQDHRQHDVGGDAGRAARTVQRAARRRCSRRCRPRCSARLSDLLRRRAPGRAACGRPRA